MKSNFEDVIKMLDAAFESNTRTNKKLDCIGCGFCCSIDLCKPGKFYFFKKELEKVKSGPILTIAHQSAPCPALEWSEEDGRYLCSLIDEFSEDEKKNGLKLGRGCGRPDSPWRAHMN
jgi:hypothetical protein